MIIDITENQLNVILNSLHSDVMKWKERDQYRKLDEDELLSYCEVLFLEKKLKEVFKNNKEDMLFDRNLDLSITLNKRI